MSLFNSECLRAPQSFEWLRNAAAVYILFGASTALACTCSELSVRDARKNADVAFAGKVESVTAIDPLTDWEPRLIVQFRVARVWKGPVDATFEMHTSYESSSCGGFPRELLSGNKTLLVYGFGRKASFWKANGVDGASNAGSLTVLRDSSTPLREDLLSAVPDQQTVYTTNICTRTMPVEYAVEDFEELGKGKDFAPLEVFPDPVLVDSTRYISNNLPFDCGQLDNARIWTKLPKPPAEAADLLAYFENSVLYSSIPRPFPVKYKDLWFTANDGRIGFCRGPMTKDVVCGRADVQFIQDPPGSGKWRISEGGVSTYCKQFVAPPGVNGG